MDRGETTDGAAMPTRTVAVPAYDGALAPASGERVRLLRKHLVAAMRGERELKPRAQRQAMRTADEPWGFTGLVARTACGLCRGWCCSKGDVHAYLDEHTLARVRAARPELDAWGILRLYTAAVADPGYAGSCVFHAARGCTLDRSLRSDLCNRYFCNGLAAFLREDPTAGAVRITAGAGQDLRVSPMLSPHRSG